MLAGFVACAAFAQTSALTGSPAVLPPEPRTVTEWLVRAHEASRRRAYAGVFVVSSGGSMASARIAHVCDGEQQIERVESLSGPPRVTFRLNDQVTTFLPDHKLVRTDRRESLRSFPTMMAPGDNALADFYVLRPQRTIETERVAGYDTDLAVLEPRDGWRFGYRVWTERRSGLVLKMQTLERDGSVIEQSAFSELQLDAPIRLEQLSQQMTRTEGYRVERMAVEKTTPTQEGWGLKAAVPGFKSTSCYRRGPRALQCVYSDGMASVSLFLEPFDGSRHQDSGVVVAMGATRMLGRRVGDWWLTAVGEVPAGTLQTLAQNLEHRK